MQVKTTSGYAEGYWKDGIYHFQGIPYAAAKRFMPPENINGRECTRLPGLEEKRFNPVRRLRKMTG